MEQNKKYSHLFILMPCFAVLILLIIYMSFSTISKPADIFISEFTALITIFPLIISATKQRKILRGKKAPIADYDYATLTNYFIFNIKNKKKASNKTMFIALFFTVICSAAIIFFTSLLLIFPLICLFMYIFVILSEIKGEHTLSAFYTVPYGEHRKG